METDGNGGILTPALSFEERGNCRPRAERRGGGEVTEESDQ